MASNYKTILCRRMKETGDCFMGDKCHFAHGESELRKNIDIKTLINYKTVMCARWERSQKCNLGSKCDFAHGDDELRDRIICELVGVCNDPECPFLHIDPNFTEQIYDSLYFTYIDRNKYLRERNFLFLEQAKLLQNIDDLQNILENTKTELANTITELQIITEKNKLLTDTNIDNQLKIQILLEQVTANIMSSGGDSTGRKRPNMSE